MDAVAQLLMLVVVSASPSLGRTEPAQPSPWTADSVARWAAEHAPLAAALNSERRAVACGLDRDDRARCAQVGLIQAVLADLAAHDQDRAAGDALETYYQILGIDQQRALLEDADQILEQLIQSADRAVQLELPDGNATALRRRQLTLADQDVQAELGAIKLRIRLAELTGHPPQAVLDARLPADALTGGAATDPALLHRAEDHPPSAQGFDAAGPEAEAAVMQAFAERSDLRAIRTLCRCMTADALPSARRLLGIVQPGLGLTVARAASSPLLALHGPHESTDDLACRRAQCQQLLEMRQSQVRAEVLRALAEVQLARRRLSLQDRAVELAEQAAEEAAQAVELEQASIGADRLAELEALETRGEQLQRQVDVAVAQVRLRQAQGLTQ